jgi:hypothetical protein
VLWFGISDAMILGCDAPCRAVLSGWFAIWFAKSAHQLMSAYSAKADQLDKRH